MWGYNTITLWYTRIACDGDSLWLHADGIHDNDSLTPKPPPPPPDTHPLIMIREVVCTVFQIDFLRNSDNTYPVDVNDLCNPPPSRPGLYD